jgi:hypothetical protein
VRVCFFIDDVGVSSHVSTFAGIGAGLCVLKHRFQPSVIGLVRTELEGKQIRLRFQQPPSSTCNTVFQIDGCPASTNTNPDSSGPSFQWTQAALDTNIVQFYQDAVRTSMCFSFLFLVSNPSARSSHQVNCQAWNRTLPTFCL